MTINGDDEKSSTAHVKTDLVKMTLSDEDRELFLKARGIRVNMPPEDAAKVRAQWPDEDILMAIGSGLF